MVMSRYGSAIQKKKVSAVGLKVVRRVSTMNAITTGTEVSDRNVTIVALTGRVGITTVKSSAHTATHDRPIQPLKLRRVGSRYSASEMP